jgi:hypothetical protein
MAKAARSGNGKPKTETPPTHREERVTEYLKYTFTNTEVLELSKSLAKGNQDMSEIEAEKKRLMADFSAKIQAFEADIASLSRKVYSGYEFRNVECKMVYHYPEVGMKTLIRLDSNVEVKTEAMSMSERQEMLPLKVEPEQALGDDRTPPPKAA